MQNFKQFSVGLSILIGNLRYAKWGSTNPFTWLYTMFSALFGEYAWSFAFYADDVQWTERSVKKLLKQKGVPTWGWDLYDGGETYGKKHTFNVRKIQARWAQAIMENAGVPICNGMLPQPKKEQRGGHLHSHAKPGKQRKSQPRKR